MLHELLVALHGIPGGIFIESTSKPDDEYVELDSYLVPITYNLPYVPKGELAVYAELLRLGGYYRYLMKFVENCGKPYRSLYLPAIASGIETVLGDYRELLCTLESDVLSDSDLGVSYFSCQLHSYKLTLPLLVQIIQKVELVVFESSYEKPNSTCKLLEIVISAASPSLLTHQIILQKLLKYVIKVFYRQLTSWMLYGMLHDPHKEFFIQAVTDFPKPTSCQQASDAISSDTEGKPSFCVAHDRIPLLFPSSFAQRVLYVGEIVHSAKADPSKSLFLKELEEFYTKRFNDLLSKATNFESADSDPVNVRTFGDILSVDSLHSLVCDMHRFVSHRCWSILLEEHKLMESINLVRAVLLLGRGELILSFIDQLKRLHFYGGSIPTGGKLTDHEHSILDRPPPAEENERKMLEYDINAAFLGAVRSVGMDDESLDTQFKFTISPNPDGDFLIGSLTTWDCLELHFIPPPPLACIFTPNVCRSYSRLFNFLLNVRRTQLGLQDYWADLIFYWKSNHCKKTNTNELPQAMPVPITIDQCLLTRSYMSFVVDNLQYYLQVDIIDSQFAHLIQRIKADQQVELVQIAHEAYLACLQAQSLLFHPNIKTCILNLLYYCREFACPAFRRQTTSNENTTKADESRTHLVTNFCSESSKLVKLLQNACSTDATSWINFKSVQAYNINKSSNNADLSLPGGWNRSKYTMADSADLSQLLLRLDFNHFHNNNIPQGN